MAISKDNQNVRLGAGSGIGSGSGSGSGSSSATPLMALRARLLAALEATPAALCPIPSLVTNYACAPLALPRLAALLRVFSEASAAP